ncbi:unnamed protein product [Mytilus coruscus]|uniref:Uncharacterized protein n=1 Tax=Mytilus coruscus TaxID=42192 RepID=A0A6J8E594_MYTCO|nr:unnamed protein product [Mytilus coruscus]
MLYVFNSLKILLSAHKTVGPSTSLEYLGIILDSMHMIAKLPDKKLVRIKDMLYSYLNRRSCTKREMLSLLGHLNYECKVIISGRSFVSYLLTLAHSVKELNHHFTITKGCRDDMAMWFKFLSQWNGISFFISGNVINASDFHLFTDASSTVGYGACVLAFYGFLRCNEFTCRTVFDPDSNLCVSDINFVSESEVNVNLKASKTDIFRQEAKNTHSEEEDVDDATHICPGIGSFIQWDPSTSCINFDQLEENWTGIMRSREMSEILTSTVPDENDKWKPLQCKIKEGGTSENLMLVRSSSDNCSDLMSFYCGNGVIVGIVSSIIAIGVVICVVIVVRRRRSAIRNPILKQDLHGPNDTEKIEHLENKNGYAYSEIEMETTKKKDYMDNGDNEYTTGTSDVYDHLNENKNRKIKTENPHAIYDHSIGDNAEPDYDSTKHVVPTNPEYQEVRIRSEEESHREKL